MSTAKQDWGTTADYTFLGSELDSLGDGSYTSSETAVDFGDPAPFAFVAEAKLTGASSGTSNVEVYMLWSADNSDFSDHAANELNGELVAVIDMLEATETIKIFQVPIRARYGKMRVKNASGAALASNAGDILGASVSVDIT